MGKLTIAAGIALLVFGLLGFPPVADLLVVALNSLFGDSHTYYRVVATDQGSGYMPALLVATGLLFCSAGIVLHYRHKRR